MAQNFVLPETYDPSFHGDPEQHPYVKKFQYRQLGKTDIRPTNIAFGTGHLRNNYFGHFEEEETIATIREAIKSGVNYIDTAPWYGNSEEVLGKALEGIPRKTYYLATKVGQYYDPNGARPGVWEGRFDFSAATVLNRFERSLKRLGVSYVDIIQVHDIEFADNLDQIVNETLPALYSLVKAGKARYVGITGYDIKPLKAVAERANVDTILSYARYNLHDLTLLDFLPFFQSKNIGIINASPVALALLTTQGPPAWHPSHPETKELAKKVAAAAKERGTTLEDVALRFSLRPPQESIATTLVGMPTRKMLQQNLAAATKPVTPEDQKLYDEFRDLFGNKNHHWEGVEVAEMKRAMS